MIYRPKKEETYKRYFDLSDDVPNESWFQLDKIPHETLTISVEEFCRITALSKTTAFKLIGLRELTTVKIGRRTLITTESLRNLMMRSVQRGGVNVS